MTITFATGLIAAIYLTVVFLQVEKKNSGAVLWYVVQALAVVLILFQSFLSAGDISILYLAALALLVKGILAPIFFWRLIKKSELTYSASAYLSVPQTLISIAILTALAHSKIFAPLTQLAPAGEPLLALALSSALLSLLLLMNRKGVLSQIIGLLSFENSIVAFAVVAGLEQSFVLQIGIIFDMFVWIVIATVFAAMIYKHFGSLDVSAMTELKE